MKYSLIAMISLFFITLSSCSKDSKFQEIQGNGIIGSWILIQSEGYDMYEGHFNKTFDIKEKIYIRSFHQDGTFHEKISDREISGSWYIEDNIVYLTYKGEYTPDEEKILELSSTHLVLESPKMKEYYDKNTFVRQVE